MTIAASTQPRHPPTDTGVGVLDRTVAILDAVQHGHSSLASIVRATGLSKTTAHRLIGALQAHGLIASVGGRGYRLGSYLLRLTTASLHEMPLVAVARPALEGLATSTGESSQLWVASIDGRVCVDTVQSKSELRAIVAVGTELPITAGSAGKVFMAWSPSDGARERMVEQASRLTANTPTGEDLERDLVRAKQRGWAFSSGEREPGVGSVSAPILGAYGEVIAVISVAGPSTRINKIGARRYAPAVLEAARDLEHALEVSARP